MLILFYFFHVSGDDSLLLSEDIWEVGYEFGEAVFEYFSFDSKEASTVHEIQINGHIEYIVFGHELFVEVDNPIHSYEAGVFTDNREEHT